MIRWAERTPLIWFVRSGLFSPSSSISTLPKAKGARAGGKKDGPRGSSVELRDSASTFADLRITNKLASVAPQLAALPEATREAIAQREVTPVRPLLGARAAAYFVFLVN